MKHFIYKTSSNSGKYYIGRHSTLDLNDGYFGSGKWVNSIKDKTSLTREILAFANSFNELLQLEEKFIAESISDPNNMNFNNRAVGFATGDLNWNRTKEARELKSARKKGVSLVEQFGEEKALEIRRKISKSKTGQKTNLPAWNRGIPHSDSTKTKISESVNNWMVSLSTAKKKEKFGNRQESNGFFNKKHSTSTLAALKEKQRANRQLNRTTCPFCFKNIDNANYSRYHGEKCKFKE